MIKIKIFLFFLLTTFSLSAQNRAVIKGVVSDAKTGEILVGVNVFLDKTSIGTSTDTKGAFILTNLSKGDYTLKATYIGYDTFTQQISINTNETKTINIAITEQSQSIDEVRIVAKSEARKIRENAMPISVISINELQGTVSDVNDVLSKTTGVKLRNTGGVGSSSRISVRGLEGKRIGYFMDERPMNDNSDFMDLNDIPIDMIERIEVYKGIVPAKLGGSAIGGAVNVVLKEYPPKYIDAGYTFSSFNTHKISTVLKTNKSYLEFGVGGSYTYSDNSYEMELPLKKGTCITRDHDRFKKLTAGGGFAAKQNKWWFDEVGLEYIYTKTAKQIQGIEHNIQEAESFSDALILSLVMEKEDFFIEGLDFDLDVGYIYTVFKFQDKAMHRYHWDGTPYIPISDYGGEIGNAPSDAKNIKNVCISKLNMNYLINECSSINFNSTLNLTKGDPSDQLKDKAIGHKIHFKSNMYSWINGLNYEMRFFDNKLTNSITAKYYMYDMRTTMPPPLNTSTLDDEKIHTTKKDWGINNAIRFRFTPKFLIKASVAYDVRLPSDNELLGDGFLIVPSGYLIPERNTSCNVGLMYDKNTDNGLFSIELNAFYMYLENMIRFVGGPLQSNYINFGKMRTLGCELEVKCDLTSFLYVYANATYQDLRDVREYEIGSTVPNSTKGDRMPNIPYLFANAGLEIHRENLFGGQEQNSRLFISSSFVEEYFYDFEQSIYQQRRIPQAITIDAGLEHSFKNQRYIFGVQANNITNEKVISEFNRPLPGRNFAVKFRYVFK